jgi:hypothetical protein
MRQKVFAPIVARGVTPGTSQKIGRIQKASHVASSLSPSNYSHSGRQARALGGRRFSSDKTTALPINRNTKAGFTDLSQQAEAALKAGL